VRQGAGRSGEAAGGGCGRLVASLVLAALVASSAAAPGRAEGERAAILLDIKGAIGPATADYVARGLGVARERQAAVVILRMDTPGGLSTSMREIIRDVLASPVPVAAYVAPGGSRAASAGTYILYAAHVAAMAPGTNLGAATPVSIGGPTPLPGPTKEPAKEKEGGEKSEKKDAPPDAHEAKAVNDAVAYIRGLADLRGRNVEWAEEAVRQAASLPAREAVERHVADLVAQSVEDLLAQIDGRVVKLGDGAETTLHTAGLAVIVLAPDWRDRLLGIITDPNIAYLLLLAGIYGIFFEFWSPGAVLPGVLGAICLLIGLFALNLVPIDYTGALLVLLGVAFMAAEAFAPTHGVLGAGGMVAFAIGSVMMFDTSTGGPGLSWTVVGATTAVSALFLIIVLAAVHSARRRGATTGGEAMIGTRGRILSWSGERGLVLVHGEEWRARARPGEEGRSLAPGAGVTVTSRDGLVLIVAPAPAPSASP
jgi:membrane-bound serine protease (ClpP class)